MPLSVLAYHDMEVTISYGSDKKALTLRSDQYVFKKGEPLDVVLDELKPDTRYFYRFSEDKETRTFHTQRSPGSTFTFTVTADPHLDRNTSPELYAITLRNALADRPDFHIDLGDTFMTDKYRNDYHEAAKQYLAQRYYFGLLCHSAPLFPVLGNHDCEAGRRNDMSDWSNRMRTTYYPNPIPDGFYSGNAAKAVENYYAREWGDALFVVLDPFWYTEIRSGGNDGWSRTSGNEQYRWLKNTLMQSDERFKFVFSHHLVGGNDRNARGGIEAVPYFDWGGRNRDGSRDFSAQRPGWEIPIHELLKKTRVSIVFHGHDHFFAKRELEGVVYQLVPQPGHPDGNSSRSAEEYGYLSGEILDGSGYMRVTVSKKEAVSEFIRSALSDDERRGHRNGEIVCSYSLN